VIYIVPSKLVNSARISMVPPTMLDGSATQAKKLLIQHKM